MDELERIDYEKRWEEKNLKMTSKLYIAMLFFFLSIAIMVIIFESSLKGG